MITPGLISVVIPCYNAKPYITATIESVLAQRRVSFEIILVDDGSSDGSADLVESRFPGVTVHRTANQGPSAARNYGTDRSRGEFIQYLDADDLLAADKLQIQISALLLTDAEVAYGDWLRFQMQPDGTKAVQERFERQLGSSPELDLFTHFWCPPAAYLIRRRAVDRVGGWRTDLPVIQDARFILDCVLNGSQFVYCAGLMAEYRVHQRDSVSTRSRTAFLRDCLCNALEVRDWWASRGQLDDERSRAVFGVLDMVATGSVTIDRGLFHEASDAIREMGLKYAVAWPAKKHAAVALMGYSAAITAADRFRRCRTLLMAGVDA
jgi:glycosyltransferase involved in cell wall biosynthesis